MWERVVVGVEKQAETTDKTQETDRTGLRISKRIKVTSTSQSHDTAEGPKKTLVHTCVCLLRERFFSLGLQHRDVVSVFVLGRAAHAASGRDERPAAEVRGDPSDS